MSELDYFLAQTVERHRRAVTGVRNGDPAEHGEWKPVHRHADPSLGGGGSEHLRSRCGTTRADHTAWLR